MRDALVEVERALERHGLLLEHDQELPSVTRIVAGAPIAGSWWGHALGRRIYALTAKLSERSGRLSAKIVDAKVTYVHPRLWPAFLSVAAADPAQRLARVPPGAAALYASVREHGPLQADDPRVPSVLASTSRELKKAIRALEERLLVHTESLHTESGAHVKVLRTWPQWCSEHSVRVAKVADAEAVLNAAVASLCEGTACEPKVPW